MKNRRYSDKKEIFSIEEYHERYFPNKSKMEPLSIEQTEEMAIHSAKKTFNKFKNALHSKHIASKSTGRR